MAQAGKARESRERLERAAGTATLQETEQGLALVGDGMMITCDFARMLPRIAPGKIGRELLARAAKVKGVNDPWALDATAGLGEDALLLAAAGFHVQLFERDEVIAALLEDGLRRAALDERLAHIVENMHLTCGDSVKALQDIAAAHEGGARGEGGAGGSACPDGEDGMPGAPCTGCADCASAPAVVYLDPMFPARTKSASVKKKFQLLHHLEAPCEAEEELLRAAVSAHPAKVVVKRPVKGPLLAGIKPSYSIAGKAVRYDVITPASVKL